MARRRLVVNANPVAVVETPQTTTTAAPAQPGASIAAAIRDALKSGRQFVVTTTTGRHLVYRCAAEVSGQQLLGRDGPPGIGELVHCLTPQVEKVELLSERLIPAK